MEAGVGAEQSSPEARNDHTRTGQGRARNEGSDDEEGEERAGPKAHRRWNETVARKFRPRPGGGGGWVGWHSSRVSSEPMLEVLRGRAGGPPALELALSTVILEAAARGERGPVLRCYRPPATVAFGRRDAFLPGFAAAARVAENHGFAPVIRSAGGRAAAYHDGCLVIEEIAVDASSMSAVQERFAREAEGQAEALRALGVEARVGEVPGEYCPGAFTVNARGRVKLVGAAQRVIRGGWLMSSVVVVERAAPIRAVLEGVYAALGLDWNPDTVGAISDEARGITLEDVEAALTAVYARRYRLVEREIPAETIAEARTRMARHVPGL